MTVDTRCPMCGRLVFRLDEQHCSPECARLADSGYESPFVSPATLAAPASQIDARLAVAADPGVRLPKAFVDCGRFGPSDSVRSIVRLAADTWIDVDRAVEKLRRTDGVASVVVLSLQQFRR